MTRRIAPLVVLLLSGCHTTPPPPPSQYGAAPPVAPLTLHFAAASHALSPEDSAALRALTPHIPATVTVDLTVSGAPAERRAHTVARLLQRNVRLLYQPGMAADDVIVTVPTSGIGPDDCRGRAVRITQDFWPGDDDSGALLLPPGCATAAIMAAQAEAPSDLIVGRKLPPGAALPYAQAIERYYRRNDAPGARPAADPQEGGGEGPSSAGLASGAGGAGAGTANPLLGGVPLGQAH
jgi:hypothetical protein